MERRYTQIEKEALAVTWACSKFANYILGRPFLIKTDHKPLVPKLSTKHLDDLPPRVLRFRLRVARFNYTIMHTPGKLLYTADTLSCTPQPTANHDLLDEAKSFVEAAVSTLLATTLVVPHSLQKETLQSPRGTPRDCLVHNENQDVSMVAWNIYTG